MCDICLCVKKIYIYMILLSVYQYYLWCMKFLHHTLRCSRDWGRIKAGICLKFSMGFVESIGKKTPFWSTYSDRKTRVLGLQKVVKPLISGKSTLLETNGLHLKMMVSNRNLLFQGCIFRCHVSFREGGLVAYDSIWPDPCFLAISTEILGSRCPWKVLSVPHHAIARVHFLLVMRMGNSKIHVHHRNLT